MNVKSIKRPGRDSNPGRRSDSPPYWTGLYRAFQLSSSILPGRANSSSESNVLIKNVLFPCM